MCICCVEFAIVCMVCCICNVYVCYFLLWQGRMAVADCWSLNYKSNKINY